jgi:hypothetical protein
MHKNEYKILFISLINDEASGIIKEVHKKIVECDRLKYERGTYV